MTLYQRIQQYTLEHHIEPARKRGEKIVTIFSREIQAEMQIHVPFRTMNAALDDPGFPQIAGIRLLERSGRKFDKTAKWVFAIEDE